MAKPVSRVGTANVGKRCKNTVIFRRETSNQRTSQRGSQRTSQKVRKETSNFTNCQ